MKKRKIPPVKVTEQVLTERDVLRLVRALIAESNQRQVALAHDLKPQHIQRLVASTAALTPLIARRLGFEIRYVRARKASAERS